MSDHRVSRVQEPWLPLGLAAVVVVLATGMFFMPRREDDLWEQSLPWLILSIGIPFVCYVAVYRLQWSPEEFFTRWGPWKWRGVHLDCLVSLDVGSASSAVWIEVVDAHGCRMRLNQVAGWTDQGEWGPLLAQAAHTCRAQISKGAEDYLLKTPSRRRRGTPGADSKGRHQRP